MPTFIKRLLWAFQRVVDRNDQIFFLDFMRICRIITYCDLLQNETETPKKRRKAINQKE